MKKVEAETLEEVHTGNLINKRKKCRDYKSMFYLENSNKAWGYSLFCMEKGITLIALAITIIVLLILAGVTIATLTGENGLLTQAVNAKEETEITSEKEMISLAVIAAK